MSRSPLQYLVEPLLDAVDRLERRVRGLPTLRLGTITGTGPLRVQLDGDTSALAATPRTIVAVGTGDRVQVAHQGRIVTVLGRIGGHGVPFAVAAGRKSLTGTGESDARGDIVFPSGRFTVPPIVTTDNEISSADSYIAGTDLVTTTKARLIIRRADPSKTFAGTYTAQWHAIQMTATSAAG